VARVSLSAPLWAVPGLVKPPGVVEDVGQDARDEASREEVGEAQEEARHPGVEGVGEGLPGGGVEEGEEEGLEEEAPGPELRVEEGLQKAPEEDLLRHPGKEGQEEEGGRPKPRRLQASPQFPVEPFRFSEGGGEEAAEEGLEAPEEEEEDHTRQGFRQGVPSLEGKAQEEHPRSPQEEEAPLEQEEKAPRAEHRSKTPVGVGWAGLGQGQGGGHGSIIRALTRARRLISPPER